MAPDRPILPSRHEVYGRALKWLWRLAYWAERTLRAAIIRRVKRGPVTERDWRRLAAMLLEDDGDA